MASPNYLTYARSGRTWREVAFHSLSLVTSPILLAYVVTLAVLGVILYPVLVGRYILTALLRSARWMSRWERSIIASTLGDHINATDVSRQAYPTFASFFADKRAWSVVGFVAARGVLGPLGAVIALVGVLYLAGFFVGLFVVAARIAMLGGAVTIATGPGTTEFDPWVLWPTIVLPLMLALAPVVLMASHGWARMTVGIARIALGDERDRLAEAEGRAAKAEAQVRIDEELHDSIGHMITMTVVQAGAGALVFDTDPEFARQALKNIEERGRTAMGELDRIITRLRGENAGRTPLPDVTDIPALVDDVSATGVDITADLSHGECSEVASRTVYGVVREAVTNAVKHAPGARVHVAVATVGDELRVSVSNTAGSKPPSTPPSGQRGLEGLAQRVRLVGGTFIAGHQTDGGFEVVATVPSERVTTDSTTKGE